MLILRRIAWAFGTVLLVGCAPTVQQAGIAEKRQPQPDDGIVVMQLVTNAEHITPVFRQWSAVRLSRDGDDGRVYELHPSAEGMIRSQMFVGAVPPGSYRIVEFLAQMGPNRLSAAVPEALGSFEVLSSATTTLGTIVFQPLFGPLETYVTDRPYIVTRLDDRLDARRYVEARFPHARRRTKPWCGCTRRNAPACSR